MSETVLSALIGLLGGIGGALITLVIARQRNKVEQPKIQADAGLSKAQAADQIGEAALALLQPYKNEVDALRAEVRTLRAEMDDLRAELSEISCERDILVNGAYQLYHQVVSLGGAPVYKPPDRREDKKT